MNRLVLIDGNAMMHRAYHALPPLTTPDGTLVNAVYGFTSMLIKIFGDLKPTHMAVAFDRPEPTFRKSLYKEYQAQRPELEEGMAAQFPIVRDVISAFHIPIYDAPGFEADDVIGTIAKHAKTGEVVIVTGDRDILQLVNNRVKVLMPTKGLSDGTLFGEGEVTEKMGVPPSQIPDLKALMGDPSDNYPGIAGIGPKTAITLLGQYGSVKKLIKAQKLRGNTESARLGLELATIRNDAPIVFSLEACRLDFLDTLDARTKLAELHFPSLVKRLSDKNENKKEKNEKQTKKQNEEKREDSEQLILVE